MGKKSPVILIGGSPGLNSKHVVLSPGRPDLTGRAKDNWNNVGWAGETSVHCPPRGNGELRVPGISTRLPARSSLLFLSRNGTPGAAGVVKSVRRAPWDQGRDFYGRGPLSLMGRK